MEADDPLPYLQLITELNFRFIAADTATAVAMAALVVLLVISALISGSEVAFFSLTPDDRKRLRENDSPAGKTALTLSEMPDRLLATLLVANNLVNVSITILSFYLLNELLEFDGSVTLALLMQVLIVTALLLLFGEILPKIYANLNTFRISTLMARPLSLLVRVFSPVSRFLIFVENRPSKLTQSRTSLSMDDLSEVLSLPSSELREDEKMLQGIVNFGNIDVSEVMTARVDVVAVDISSGLKKLIQTIIESGYSRIPVYDDSFDNVRGILYIKDILPHIGAADDFGWQTLIRPPYFVPETKRINDLLAEFQSKKIHMAIVIDEYGGTQGIVSLEDILEEIVGEIADEFDEDESTFTRIDDKNYIFEAKTQLNDFYKITGVSPEAFDRVRGDADTLAGLILEIQGEIPGKNEVISIENCLFQIESVD